ncbi:hypothetical protein D9Q98_006783 [Chlorella vulgaris]|uniref:Peroxisomal membrane protein PEX14 n=1 Tax=Chlorella vulgaris TaxID=3077 RepID=A0A9D4TIV8_CHLVU|nr:hypothetical protein D9Q98_006783 [Chlorella vulgaris]
MSEAGDEASEGSSGGPMPSLPPAPAAVREDQVQNAMAFLSHPKVRTSAPASKREFLQRKGLTEAEIDEAFRRAPQAPAAATDAAAPAQPPAVTHTLNHLQPQPPQYQPQAGPMVLHQASQQQQQGVRWTQVVLGAGFLGASAYAAKALVWPYMADCYHTWRGHVRPPPRPRLLHSADSGEAAEATKAVAEAIQAQTAELRSSVESMKQVATSLEAATNKAAKETETGGGGLTVTGLREELRSFAATLQEGAGAAPSPGAAQSGAADGSSRVESELCEIKALLAEILRSPSGSHSPGERLAGPGPPTTALTPHSVTSATPQQQPRSYAAPSGLPPLDLGAGASEGGATDGMQQQEGQQQQKGQQQGGQGQAQALVQEVVQQQDGTLAPGAAVSAPFGVGMSVGEGEGAAGGASEPPPPHPASYLEVLEMLERGQTPPGIRTDINDRPPDPLALPVEPRLKPRPKPWEKERSTNGGLVSAAGGASAAAAESDSGSVSTAAGAGSGAGGAAAAAGSPATPPRRPLTAGTSTSIWPATAASSLSPLRVSPPPADGGVAPGDVGSPELGVSPFEQGKQQQQAQQAQQIPQQQAAQQQQQAQSGSFRSRRPASSIFEAVSSAPESPNVIAGRLSPARPEGGGGTQAQQQGQGQAQAGGQAQGQQRPGGPLSPAANFGALLAAAEERSGVKEAGSWLSGGSTADPVLEGSGSGIGRPSSRTWRPPPIPHPTITASGSKSGASTPATSIAHAAGGAAVANGHAVNGGDAIELGSSGRAASGASLGEDFSSA